MTGLPPPGEPTEPDGLTGGGRLSGAGLTVLAATTTLALCLIFQPWSVGIQPRDATVFFYIAERAAAGTPPYLSALMPHNAGAVLTMGAGIWLGRLVGVDAVFAARAVTILLFAATGVLVSATAARLAGNRWAGLLTLLAFLTFAPLAFTAAATGQPKNVLAFFVALTLYLTAQRRHGWAGAAAAGTFLCYQPGLILVAGAVLAAAADPTARRSLVRCLVGVVTPVLLYVGYLALVGALGAAYDQSYAFISRRAELKPDLHEAYGDWMRIWPDAFGRWNLLPVVGLAVLGSLWAGVLAGPRKAVAALRRAPGWILLLVSGAGTAAYAVLDSEGVADSYLGLPFLAVLVGVAVDWIVRRVTAVRPRLGPPLYFLAVVAFLAIAARGIAAQRRRTDPLDLAAQRAAAREVGSFLRRGQSVFALGPTHLLAMNRADNWMIYSSSHSVRPQSGYWSYHHPDQAFVPAVGGRLPDVILWSAGHPLGWPAWLSTEYVRVASPDLDRLKIEVWVRPGAPQH